MNPAIQLSYPQAFEFLLHIAPLRPVFIWGPPGIGKSALVNQFASELGFECVSLLGSQLAPEDLIGIPAIENGCSRFYPPALIQKQQPYVLFLDELNASSLEIQKAFYSLIHEKRIGEYHLPEGTLIIGAGNRARDTAVVKPMPSALINRMVHIHLRSDHRQWLNWAQTTAQLHPWVIEYIQMRPDHLWSDPPKIEEPFSTPRSWHMLSDALYSLADKTEDSVLDAVCYGTLSPHHAGHFKGFVKQVHNKFMLNGILKGEVPWPSAPADRDVLYFLAESFRQKLYKELPQDEVNLRREHKELVLMAKDRIRELARISVEIAQVVVAETDENQKLPAWFLIEIIRDLPRLALK